MKKIVALLITVVIIAGTAMTAFGYNSRSGGSAIRYATTGVTVAGVVGQWTYNQTTGEWSFSDSSRKYVSTWALIQCKDGLSRWFFFDEKGTMLTGWVWIKGADGLSRCYYLEPSNPDTKGACYLNGKTPDGYYVTSSGEWFANGKVQTK